MSMQKKAEDEIEQEKLLMGMVDRHDLDNRFCC